MQNNNEVTYMKFLIDGLPPELLKKAEIELGETEEIRAECLKELKSLIKGEPDLNACMEEAFLLRFLRSKKYKVDKAFKTLKNYYTYKAKYSGILTDFRPSEVSKCLETNCVGPLEYRDSSYATIGICRAGMMNLNECSPDEILACVLVLAELGINIKATSVGGYAAIFDFAGISFQNAKKFASPTFLYRLIMCIQDVIPCRIKGYHIVNQPYFLDVFLNVARTFMTEKLSSRLHLHGSDMKSLYKHIPQDILPEELGGKQGPVSEFLTEYQKTVYSMEEHFIQMNKFGYKGKTLKELQHDNPQAKVT